MRLVDVQSPLQLMIITAKILPAMKALTAKSLRAGLDFLSQQDADLARVVDHLGPPPLWARDPGFCTLLRIVLEQQVSLASAAAAYDRLLAVAVPLNPSTFLQIDDVTLKLVGFSRQKTAYCRGLAKSLLDGTFDLTAVENMYDDDARSALIRIKGIGPWTADIYLLMALRRPDIWPSGDLALAVAAQSIKGLRDRPTSDQLKKMSERWQPWRAVAARVLWHYYLSKEKANDTQRVT
jgi:DNA-3-methyladenine glycosylase II